MTRVPVRAIAVSIVLLGLAACSRPTSVDSSGDIPRPTMTEHTRVFTLASRENESEVTDDSGSSLERIAAFVSALETQARVTVSGGNTAQAAATRRALRERLGTLSEIELRDGGRRTSDGGTVVIAVSWVTLSVPGCPDWTRGDRHSFSRLHSSNFGCATSQTLAAMLERPRDLSSPTALGPADGTREALAIDRYRTDKVKDLNTGGGFTP